MKKIIKEIIIEEIQNLDIKIIELNEEIFKLEAKRKELGVLLIE